MHLQTSLLGLRIESARATGTIVAAWLPTMVGISGLSLMIATDEGKLIDINSTEVVQYHQVEPRAVVDPPAKPVAEPAAADVPQPQPQPVPAPQPQQQPKKSPPVTPLAK